MLNRYKEKIRNLCDVRNILKYLVLKYWGIVVKYFKLEIKNTKDKLNILTKNWGIVVK